MKKITVIIFTIFLLLPMCISVSAETFELFVPPDFELFVPPEYGFTNVYTNYVFTPESTSIYNLSKEYLKTRKLRGIDDMLDGLFSIELAEEDIAKEDVWYDNNPGDAVSYLFSSRRVEKYDVVITMCSRYIEINREKQLAYCSVKIAIGEKALKAERMDIESDLLDFYLSKVSTKTEGDFRESYTLGFTPMSMPDATLQTVNAYYENTDNLLHSISTITQMDTHNIVFEKVMYPENAKNIDDWYNILQSKEIFSFGPGEFNGNKSYYLNYLELNYEIAYPEVEYPISAPKTGTPIVPLAITAAAAFAVLIRKKQNFLNFFKKRETF